MKYTTREQMRDLVEQATKDGLKSLYVERERKAVVLYGFDPDNATDPVFIATLSNHTCEHMVEEFLARYKKRIRLLAPGTRRPELAGQVILKIDTGIGTLTHVIPRRNRQRENNADTFLRRCVEFGILRHGLKDFLKMVEEEGAKYPDHQTEGLKQ